MPDSYANHAVRLYEAACLYLQAGWSVVPLWGDSRPEMPKAPAVQWRDYQQRLPTQMEIERWFLRENHVALGIVCGSLSRLMVVDFDTPELAEEFERCYPDLAFTLVVRSGQRRMPHYYYHLPEQLRVHSRHIQGADLLGEGAYVVAVPTEISGHSWEFMCDEVPLLLSPADLKRIITFFGVREYVDSGEEQQTRQLSPIVDTPATNKSPALHPEPQPQSTLDVSAQTAQNWYHALAIQIGRNNALFRISCYLRDYGWSRAEVLRLLINVHIVQPPPAGHTVETPQQREAEAFKTICSAFKKLPRPHIRHPTGLSRQLPNSIREMLIQNGQLAAARVLDGLMLQGIRAGFVVTERLICEILHKLRIGRRTVQIALKAIAKGIHALFMPLKSKKSPLNPPQAQNALAASMTKSKTTKCDFVRGTKRVKSKGRPKTGCPPCSYIVPSVGYLCRILNVQPGGSDAIQAEDLHNPKTYRQALQRGLMQRRPGLYSRRWLAARLGISKRTCRRYDRQIGLRVRPTYREKYITWENLSAVPRSKDDFEPVGMFLETPDRVRYPPFQVIAGRLLKKYPWLLFKCQDWNFYAYGRVDADWHLIERKAKAVPHESRIPREGFCEEIHELITWPTSPPQAASVAYASKQMPAPEDCSFIRELAHVSEITPEKPVVTAHLHTLVEQLYQKVNALSAEHALTRAKAHQLVEQYGVKQVKQALKLLETRQNIRNPAGFVIVFLRSESRFGTR